MKNITIMFVLSLVLSLALVGTAMARGHGGYIIYDFNMNQNHRDKVMHGYNRDHDHRGKRSYNRDHDHRGKRMHGHNRDHDYRGKRTHGSNRNHNYNGIVWR